MKTNIYDTLRKLVDWTAQPETSALSLYLDISPGQEHEAVDFARDRCEELLELREDAPDFDAFSDLVHEWLEALPGVVTKARKADYDGLALFLCADPPLAERVTLRFAFDNSASVSNHLELAGLLTQAEEYERSVCVCLAPETAKVADVHVGDLVGVREVRATKRRELAGELNVALSRLIHDEPALHVILFGEPEVRQATEEELSRDVRARIIDREDTCFDPGDPEFLRSVHRILQEYERRSEAAGVARLMELKAADRDVAVGLDETLTAINKGKIKTLYILQSFEARGWMCDVCDDLGSLPAPPACLACGATVSEVPLEEYLINQAAGCGAEIETVFANDTLSQAGGIGALVDEV